MTDRIIRATTAAAIAGTCGILLVALAEHLAAQLPWLAALALISPDLLRLAAVGAGVLVGVARLCWALPAAPASCDVELQMACFPTMPAPVGLVSPGVAPEGGAAER